MANKKDSLIARILMPPAIVFAGIVALWENEGRFNYYQEANDSIVITSAASAPANQTIAITDDLVTDIPIPGEYVEQFIGYHLVNRRAEIYSWDESEDSDGHTQWKKGWYSHLDNNSRNRDLRQTLSSRTLYAPKYQLGELKIEPSRIHFVDDSTAISRSDLTLTKAGQNAGLQPSGNYFYKGAGISGDTQLGDERVNYSGIRNAPRASYFGFISSGTAIGKKFKISQSFMSGIIQNDGILHHLVNGEREQALQTMKSHFTRLMWIVRGAGTFAIVIGIYMFFSFFVNLLYRIPLLGDMVSAGVFLVSLALGLTISILVMLSSILVHHPFMVTLPLVLIIGGIIMVKRQSKKASANVQQTLNNYQKSHQPETQNSASTSDADLSSTSSNTAEATFMALAKIAVIDGDLDKKENKFIIKWGKKSGIDEARMKTLFKHAKQGGGEEHKTNRNDLILMTCLAMADGVLSTNELSHLNKIGWNIGLTAKDVREIIVGVESGTLAPT